MWKGPEGGPCSQRALSPCSPAPPLPSRAAPCRPPSRVPPTLPAPGALPRAHPRPRQVRERSPRLDRPMAAHVAGGPEAPLAETVSPHVIDLLPDSAGQPAARTPQVPSPFGCRKPTRDSLLGTERAQLWDWADGSPPPTTLSRPWLTWGAAQRGSARASPGGCEGPPPPSPPPPSPSPVPWGPPSPHAPPLLSSALGPPQRCPRSPCEGSWVPGGRLSGQRAGERATGRSSAGGRGTASGPGALARPPSPSSWCGSSKAGPGVSDRNLSGSWGRHGPRGVCRRHCRCQSCRGHRGPDAGEPSSAEWGAPRRPPSGTQDGCQDPGIRTHPGMAAAGRRREAERPPPPVSFKGLKTSFPKDRQLMAPFVSTAGAGLPAPPAPGLVKATGGSGPRVAMLTVQGRSGCQHARLFQIQIERSQSLPSWFSLRCWNFLPFAHLGCPGERARYRGQPGLPSPKGHRVSNHPQGLRTPCCQRQGRLAGVRASTEPGDTRRVPLSAPKLTRQLSLSKGCQKMLLAPFSTKNIVLHIGFFFSRIPKFGQK